MKLSTWALIVLAVVVVLGAFAAGLMWLNARPALEAVAAEVKADQTHVCADKDGLPAGFPRSPIAIQTDDDAEQAAWRLACKRIAGGCPRTIGGEVRYVGFRLYLPLHLTACQTRAISLQPASPLGAALARIYPNGAPSEISREAALCVRRTALRPRAALPAICEGI